MKAPAFWFTENRLAQALAPLSAIGAAVTRHRVRRPGLRVPVPVICCGGLTVGGAGKTTVALAIGSALRARGAAVHFVTRGYGGQAKGPVRVDPARHDAARVGDEALLLAGVAPCWVARDRAAGALRAWAAGASMIVLDDGLQNPALHKTLSLLVIDGATGFGNGRVLPAGPLREPVAAGVARAGAAVLIGEDRCGAQTHLPPALPVLRARLICDRPDLAGRRVFALAGIAFPAKFHRTLRQAGALLAGHADFSDHHRFTTRELDQVLARAAALDAQPITTPKDAVRLPATHRACFQVAGVALDWADPALLDQVLRGAMP